MFKRFLNNARLGFEFLSVIATLVGLYITIASTVKGSSGDCVEQAETFKTVYYGLIVMFSSLLVLTIIFAFRNGKYIEERYGFLKLGRKLDESNIIKNQIASMQHNIFHSARDVNSLISNIEAEIVSVNYEELSDEEFTKLKIDKARYLEHLKRNFKDYTNVVMSNVKDIFDVVTDDVNCVSIKLFVFDEDSSVEDDIFLDEITVVTFDRDNVSKRSREGVDRELSSYQAIGNTAFREILSRDNPKFYYFCNDLRKNDEYVNLNSEWRKHYNACLVSALNFKLGVEDQEVSMMGAICVDNFKGKYNENQCRDILASIGDVFSMSLLRYNMVKSNLEDL